MTSESPSAPAPRRDGVWLVGVVGLATATVAVAARSAWYAWDEVLRQGYLELGFERTVAVSLADGAARGAGLGARWGLAWVALPLFVIAVAWRDFTSPASLSRRLARRGATLRAQGAVALLWALGCSVQVLAADGAPIRTALLLAVPALVAVAVLEVLARRARALSARGEVLGATPAAALGALLPALLLAFPVNQERHVRHPLADDSLLANGVLAAGTVVLFLLLRARSLRRPSWTARGGVALLAAAALAAGLGRGVALGLAEPALSAERPWNVVLITIDTLRADSVTLEEPAPSERDLTPHLRRLARRGTNFRVAVSQAPWTMPAMGSILTGRYSMQHGAVSPTGRLAPRMLTLAEVLREAGYRTGAVVSNRYVGPEHGFAQGYDAFVERFPPTLWAHNAEEVTDGALGLLEGELPSPFFLYAHYSDPHFGYVDHPAWRFADAYRGPMREPMRFPELSERRGTLDAQDLGFLRDAYEEEVAYTDVEVGRLLDALGPILHETLVVLVADHGEGFLEHGYLGHTSSLHDELVRVPLVVVVPGRDGGRVRDDPVETRAIFSTVLDAVGVDHRAEGMPASLLAEPGGESRRVFSMLWRSSTGAAPETGARFASLRTERWKLILDLDTDRIEVYDLVADPGEQVDRAGDAPAEVAALEPVLREWLREMLRNAADAPRADLSPAELENLEALGYL